MLRFLQLTALCGILFIQGCGQIGSKPQEVVLEPTFLEQTLDQKHKKVLEDAFSKGWNSETPDLDQFVHKLILKDSVYFGKLVAKYPVAIPQLPKILADQVRKLANEDNLELAQKTLDVAEESFENNPDVLAVGGAIRMLLGQPTLAIPFLENALSWDSNNIIASFYLGSHLINDSDFATRSRAKNLLDRVVFSRMENLSTRAGIILLTQNTTPLTKSDVVNTINSLEDLGLLEKESLDEQPLNVRLLLAEIAAEVNSPSAQKLLNSIRRENSISLEARFTVLFLALQLGLDENYRRMLDDAEIKMIDKSSNLYARKEALIIAYDLRQNREDSALKRLQELDAEGVYAETIARSFRLFIVPGMPFDIKKEFLRILAEQPVVNAAEHLEAFQSLSSLEPLKEDYWVSRALEKVFPKIPNETADWILKSTFQGELLIQHLITRKNDSELTKKEKIILLEALIQMEYYPKAALELERLNESLSTEYVSFYEALITFLQSSDSTAALAPWINSNQLARSHGDFSLLRRLGWLAVQMNQPQSALTCLYDAFSAGVGFTENEATQLLSLNLKYGSLVQSIQIAEYLAKVYPENTDNISNLSYFNFLANRNIDSSVETMRNLTTSHPNVTNYQLTLALGLLKSGRINEAGRLIEDSRIELTEIGSRGQMIYAAILSAQGQKSIARGLVKNISLDELIPEEAALIDSL